MAGIFQQIFRRNFIMTLKRSIANPGAVATGGQRSGGYKLWKRLSFFVAMPTVGLCMLNAYMQHQKEHDQPRQEFVKYEYLRRRDSRFPWGDGEKSLFHNPNVNALPDGYED